MNNFFVSAFGFVLFVSTQYACIACPNEDRTLESLAQAVSEDIADSQLQSALMLPFARGLRLFDWNVHKVELHTVVCV